MLRVMINIQNFDANIDSPFIFVTGDNYIYNTICVAKIVQKLGLSQHIYNMNAKTCTEENLNYMYRNKCNGIKQISCIIVNLDTPALYGDVKSKDLTSPYKAGCWDKAPDLTCPISLNVLYLLSDAKNYEISVILVNTTNKSDFFVMSHHIREKFDYVFIGQLQDNTDKKIIHHQYVSEVCDFDVFKEIHHNLTKENNYMCLCNEKVYFFN